MTQLLSVDQVAKRLKVSKSYVYELIKTGHLAALKFKSLKVPDFALDEFISSAIGKDFTDLEKVKSLL